MAMGRNIRVFGRYKKDDNYSLLIEQKGVEESLVVYSNNFVQKLHSQEVAAIRGEYDHVCDGYALLGNLTVPVDNGSLHFLVIATQCSSVGRLKQTEVYKVGQVKLISLRGFSQDGERSVVTEIGKILSGGGAFFGWSSAGFGDISLSAQRASGSSHNTDGQFFWNKLLHLPYIRAGVGVSAWLVRLMVGSVEIRTVYSGATQVRACLISRLSCDRVGTRYNTRGVDDDGHVANFVETEQLLLTDNDVASFIQVRGSVPLFWEQPGVNVGSHKVKLSRGSDLSKSAFEKHFELLTRDYGNVVILNLLGINLVGSKEGEAQLSTAYQEQQTRSRYLGMTHHLWDFHAEGGSKHLDKLWSVLGDDLGSCGHFCSVQGSVSSSQRSVVRVNCMDCLDRSNVTQAWIGHRMLGSMLTSLMGPEVKENTVARLRDMFHQMWVNNGNSLSKLYAGTGALSQGGSKLLDGARSAARTIQNNLLDKDKQEAFDILVLGSIKQSDFRDRAGLVLPRHLLNAPAAFQQSICEKWSQYSKHCPYRIAVGNYNINGGKHFRSVVFKDVSLDNWLFNKSDLVMINNDTKEVDMFAVGFEEMVDLDTKNIVSASGENARQWCGELLATLNSNGQYSLVTYTQLVGVCLYVFVRTPLAPMIRDVQVDQVKTGLGGTTGNKGTVGISLTLGSSSICFLCSHFAAGQSQVAERNNDYQEAVRKISFANGRTALVHDYVFWCGDFNYRINMERQEVIETVSKREYSRLMEHDQLKVEMDAGNVFQGFREGNIGFAPTYKYDLFSDDWDSSEKCRVPAYTDRILFTRRKPRADTCPPDWSDGDIVSYTRAELKQSDHRPVLAVFDVELRHVNTESRDNVIRDHLLGNVSWDGVVMMTSDRDLVITSDTVTSVVSAVKTLLGDNDSVQPAGHTVSGQLRLQLQSVSMVSAIIGRSVMVDNVRWTVSSPGSSAQSYDQETQMFSATPTLSKRPSSRPQAPPARPSAPPSVRPSRPAPGVPPSAGPKQTKMATLSLTTQVSKEDSDEEDGDPMVRPTLTLAPIDNWSPTPAVTLAPLTWPDQDQDTPPSFAPPSPNTSACDDAPPPSFAPPVLHSEPPSCPPPRLPPPCPPRVPPRKPSTLPNI